MVWAGVAVVVVLVVAAFAGWLVTRPGEPDAHRPASGEPSAATTTPSEPTAPVEETTAAAPSTSPSTTLASSELIDPGSIAARASSTLPPVTSRGLTYDASNVLDGNAQTAWSQDGSEGGLAPIGSWLELSWGQPWSVESLTITNGYAKTDKAFTENLRPRSVRVTSDAGDEVVVELLDRPEPQTVDVDLPAARRLRFTIESVWEVGSIYTDVAITEVAVRARPA